MSKPSGSKMPSTHNRQISASQMKALQDTPWNKGSGSHSSYDTRNTQEEYKQYLKEDLRNNKVTMPFKEFLTHILGVSPEWRDQKETLIDKIAESKEYNKRLEAYTAKIAGETDRYHPFAKLANHVMQELQSSKYISFCGNDPVLVRGSCARRKPDVCTAHKDVVDEGTRGGVDNLAKNGPAECPLCWADLLSFWELKRVESNLTHLMKKARPSSSSQSGAAESISSDTMSQLPAGSISTFPSRAPNVDHQMITSRQHPSEAAPLASGCTTSSKRRANALSRQSSKKRSMPKRDSDISSRKRARTNSEQSGTEDDTQDHLSLQCASYALELLLHGGLRSHIIAGSVTGQKITLLYYDHSIIIESTPIDFVTYRSEFIALLNGLVTLTPEQWGYHTLAGPPYEIQTPRADKSGTVSLSTLEGKEIKLKGGKVLRVGKTVYHQHGLIGRGTWVLRAELQDHPGSDVIVKLSWSPKSRKSEHAMINKARGDATLYGDQWVLDHLPNVLHAQDFDATNEQPVKGVMHLLGDKYEPRVPRLLVMEELFPITELVGASDLAKAFRDIFNCYEWLYIKAEIFHRDISLNNMMYRKNKDGEIFGVLNDYDLAIFRSNTNPSSKNRAGTKPFMAIDLLGENPDVHRYRHDLESMFYVIVFVTTRYHDGKEILNPPLQGWLDFGENHLRAEKEAFLTRSLPPTTPPYAQFRTWTYKMRVVLYECRGAYALYEDAQAIYEDAQRENRVGSTSPPRFDLETFDGRFSFDTFRAILKYAIT